MRGSTGKSHDLLFYTILCFSGLGQIPVWNMGIFEVAKLSIFHVKPSSHVQTCFVRVLLYHTFELL